LQTTAARLREIAVRSQTTGKFLQELPIRPQEFVKCLQTIAVRPQEIAVRPQEIGKCLQEFGVRLREFGKFLQECVRSRESLELGRQSNWLIYSELAINWSKIATFVGRARHSVRAGFWCLNERQAEDCPPYRQ
jgi:hypothetical protein